MATKKQNRAARDVRKGDERSAERGLSHEDVQQRHDARDVESARRRASRLARAGLDPRPLVSSLGDLRDELRMLASSAASLGESSRTGHRGTMTQFQEVLLVLSDCINVADRPGRAELDAAGHTSRAASRSRSLRGIDASLLAAMHAPARKALAESENALARADGERTGVRFLDPRSGAPQRAAAGAALVARLQTAIRDDGLRGARLAAAVASDPLWARSALATFARLRWTDPRALMLLDDPRTILERWCATTNLDGVADFEVLAVSLLSSLGMTAKDARNCVSAADDMRAKRRQTRG